MTTPAAALKETLEQAVAANDLRYEPGLLDAKLTAPYSNDDRRRGRRNPIPAGTTPGA